ncbi:MAG TPA: AgmX/PglI C-terminal domain-containing protein [Labilithrix sp.]|nr:AgmX/PglI C-terminal domain-containing protein [Labilithrix sp.]
MKRYFFLALSVMTVSIGCSDPQDHEPSPVRPSISVDEAIADAETGRDLPAARARLEAVLVDASVSKSDRAKAALTLSRLIEPADRERAIQLTEEAVAAGSEGAETRLFTLLTGEKAPSRHRGPRPPVVNSARALAKYFPAATPGGKVDVQITHFGGSDDGGPWPSGTFDVGSALRENALEACGLCDEVDVSIHTGSSRVASWTSIPHALPNLDHALVVTYVDAEMMPPARYEKWFAASVVDLKSAIEAGSGLVAVKERPGAPPLVTIAAPRVALLPLVEAQFAEMSELPLVPKRIAVDTRLSKDEIRAAFRSRFGAYKSCYRDLLSRNSGASGTIELAFTIKGDGSLAEVTGKIDGSLDATFRTCVVDAARTIRYPRWSPAPNDTTTVRYPLTFAP